MFVMACSYLIQYFVGFINEFIDEISLAIHYIWSPQHHQHVFCLNGIAYVSMFQNRHLEKGFLMGSTKEI